MTNSSPPSPSISNAPEWKLLLAASAPQDEGDRISETLKAHVDWDAVLRLADRHGVSSLMYKSLERYESDVPAGAFAVLRERNEINIRKALFLTRELVRVLERLTAREIETLPYKGIVLAENYYGDMALRQCGDLDFFVPARDVGRVKNAVRELGFTERVAIPVHAENDYVAAGYECSFDSPAGKNLLELQWALQPRYYAVDFHMEGLFARAVKVSFAGRSVKTLSPEDLLLVLAIHAAKHVWGRLIWLCDIGRISQRELDWKQLQRSASLLGVERILHVTILLSEQLAGARVPAEITALPRKDRVTLDLVKEIESSIADGIDYEARKVSYFRLMMRLRERRIDRLRFLTRLAFTPGPGEWEAVNLPRVLFPFYRLVRMARLASHFARRAQLRFP